MLPPGVMSCCCARLRHDACNVTSWRPILNWWQLRQVCFIRRYSVLQDIWPRQQQQQQQQTNLLLPVTSAVVLNNQCQSHHGCTCFNQCFNSLTIQCMIGATPISCCCCCCVSAGASCSWAPSGWLRAWLPTTNSASRWSWTGSTMSRTTHSTSNLHQHHRHHRQH